MIETRLYIPGDEVELKPILQQHVCDSSTGNVLDDEITEILTAVQEQREYEPYYIALNTQGKVIGCMAHRRPSDDMLEHFRAMPKSSQELIHAFTDGSEKGIGSTLLESMVNDLRTKGFVQLLVHSGPRYKESWGFYDKVMNADHGHLHNKYGEGNHAKTWWMDLTISS